MHQVKVHRLVIKIESGGHLQSTAPRIVQTKTRTKPSVLSPGLVTAERAAIPPNRYSGCMTNTTARNEMTGSE